MKKAEEIMNGETDSEMKKRFKIEKLFQTTWKFDCYDHIITRITTLKYCINTFVGVIWCIYSSFK